jgi:hypothetical protein
MKKVIFKIIRILFCCSDSKQMENIEDQDINEIQDILSKDIYTISMVKVLFWLLTLIVIIDLTIILLQKEEIIQNFSRGQYVMLIFVELLIFMLVLLVTRISHRRKTNLYLVKKQNKSSEKCLKNYCYKNNLSLKQLPRYIVVGNDSFSVSDLLHRWKYSKEIGNSLFDALNVWISKKAIAYELMKINSPDIEILFHDLRHKNENAISGIIFAMSCEKLLNSYNNELMSITDQLTRTIKDVSSAFTKSVPVYFLFTYTDRIVGSDVFIKRLTDEFGINVLGFTTTQKNDTVVDYSMIHHEINRFADELDILREKLLRKTSPKNETDNNCDRNAALFYSVSKLKIVVFTFKKVLTDIEEKFKDNLQIFSFRGFYFTNTKKSLKSMQDLEKQGKELQDGNVHESEVAMVNQYNLDQSRNIFHSELINDLILKESKTVRPLYKSYFRQKTTLRIIFNSIILLFIGFLFYTYIEFIGIAQMLHNDSEKWKPVLSETNWVDDTFPPVLEKKYEVFGGQEKNANHKKTPRQNKSGHALLMAGKLDNGMSIIRYFNEIFKLSISCDYLPSVFILYNKFEKTSISNRYYEAVSRLFSMSFKIPVYILALETYLYHQNIVWNTDTYEYLLILIKTLDNIDGYEHTNGLFDKIGRLIKKDKIKFNPILNFIFKNNVIDKSLPVNEFYEDENKYQTDNGTKSYYYSLCGTNKNMHLYDILKDTFKINNSIPLEYKIIERFEDLLKFPLSHGDFNMNKFTTYENVLKANVLLNAFDYYSIEKFIKENKINDDVLSKIKLAKKIGTALEKMPIDNKNKIYLQNYMITERSIKKSDYLNGTELFVCAKLQSTNSIDIKSEITRKDTDIYLGNIPIDEYYPYNLKLFTSYANARNNISSCVLDLPDYWTGLYLLFDGPTTMPLNYRYPYWATWEAAEYCHGNIWKTRIIIKGDVGRKYCFYIKFNLDKKLAKVIKALNELYFPSNKTKHTEGNETTNKGVKMKNSNLSTNNMRKKKKLNHQTKGAKKT